MGGVLPADVAEWEAFAAHEYEAGRRASARHAYLPLYSRGDPARRSFFQVRYLVASAGLGDADRSFTIYVRMLGQRSFDCGDEDDWLDVLIERS